MKGALSIMTGIQTKAKMGFGFSSVPIQVVLLVRPGQTHRSAPTVPIVHTTWVCPYRSDCPYHLGLPLPFRLSIPPGSAPTVPIVHTTWVCPYRSDCPYHLKRNPTFGFPYWVAWPSARVSCRQAVVLSETKGPGCWGRERCSWVGHQILHSVQDDSFAFGMTVLPVGMTVLPVGMTL